MIVTIFVMGFIASLFVYTYCVFYDDQETFDSEYIQFLRHQNTRKKTETFCKTVPWDKEGF